MSRKLKKLSTKKERAILSDTLPYELPPIFSNKDYYKFLLDNQVEYDLESKILSWRDGGKYIEFLLTLIFNFKPADIKKKSVTRSGKKIEICSTSTDDFYTKPFTFQIKHKEDSFRNLSIAHPKTQFRVANFYHHYKESILYYCSLSPVSLRKPCRESKFVFYRDKLHLHLRNEDPDEIEEENKEYENLKSFFVYKKHSNIFKFYESYQFHRCEKKYEKLLKLDISKCFDSIYTHSITWAIFGREVVQDIFLTSAKKDKPLENTFAGRFDSLMQMTNARETNGIIIGPEFSRIFAEIILQHVEIKLLKNISQKKEFKSKRDFELLRYLDDYFLFFNNDSIKSLVLQELQLILKEFKLNLNENKATLYEKPIVTEITIAKNAISDLLNSKLCYDKVKSSDESESHKISLSSKDLITSFKVIIKNSGVKYKDILNWTLALVETYLKQTLNFYSNKDTGLHKDKNLIRYIVNLTEFVFFAYSVTPRVNTTLRLCRIITIIKSFLDANNQLNKFEHTFQLLAAENIVFLLDKFKLEHVTQVETLYLFTQLAELGENYQLSEEQLCNFLCLDLSKDQEPSTAKLNHLTITVILFYIKRNPKFDKVRAYIEGLVVSKLADGADKYHRDTELTLLLLDILYCPYISNRAKRRILRSHNAMNENMIRRILADNKNWFTTWVNFDFRKALDAKRSLEVY